MKFRISNTLSTPQPVQNQPSKFITVIPYRRGQWASTKRCLSSDQLQSLQSQLPAAVVAQLCHDTGRPRLIAGRTAQIAFIDECIEFWWRTNHFPLLPFALSLGVEGIIISFPRATLKQSSKLYLQDFAPGFSFFDSLRWHCYANTNFMKSLPKGSKFLECSRSPPLLTLTLIKRTSSRSLGGMGGFSTNKKPSKDRISTKYGGMCGTLVILALGKFRYHYRRSSTLLEGKLSKAIFISWKE